MDRKTMERLLRLDWQELVATAKSQRKKHGLTQAKLAALAQVSKPTLNQFEQGKTTLTLDSVFKILRTLGMLI
jgi:transcriptional regulator with XRE-family HTH domain